MLTQGGVGVVNDLIKWGRTPDRIVVNSYFTLLLHLCSIQGRKFLQQIKEYFEKQSVWMFNKEKDTGNIPDFLFLAAICFSYRLQENQYATSVCKAFWSTGQPVEIQAYIYQKLNECEFLDAIWLLAADENNKTAIEIIEGDHKDIFYSYAEGVKHIDDYEKWSEPEQLKSIISKLCSNGAFEKAVEEITANPVFYHRVLYLFNTHGNKKTKATIKRIIREITEDQWFDCLKNSTHEELNSLLDCVESENKSYTKAFANYFVSVAKGTIEEPIAESVQKEFKKLLVKTSNNLQKLVLDNMSTEDWEQNFNNCEWLVQCINTGDHKYIDAFKNYCLYIIDSNNYPGNWFFDKFTVLLGKVGKDSDIILSKITKYYFENEVDSLNDLSFNCFSNHLTPFVKDVSEKFLMNRINEWMENEQFQRIRWFLALNIIFNDPLDSLKSRVREGLVNEENPIYIEMNQKLKLKIEIEQEE